VLLVDAEPDEVVLIIGDLWMSCGCGDFFAENWVEAN